jgi:hypothetical protein
VLLLVLLLAPLLLPPLLPLLLLLLLLLFSFWQEGATPRHLRPARLLVRSHEQGRCRGACLLLAGLPMGFSACARFNAHHTSLGLVV